MIDARQAQELVGGGDSLLHYHLSDRIPTHATLHGLQEVAVVRSVSANTTLTYEDDYVLVDTTAGSVAITLPASKAGKEFEIIKIAAANSVTVDGDGSETICGSTTMLLTTQWSAANMKAVAGGWVLI